MHLTLISLVLAIICYKVDENDCLVFRARGQKSAIFFSASEILYLTGRSQGKPSSVDTFIFCKVH